MIRLLALAEGFLKEKKSWVLVMGSILFLNSFLYLITEIPIFQHLEKIQSSSGITGFGPICASKFFYFYYYTGNFPLATLNDPLSYSKKSAFKEIESKGDRLIMEIGNWARCGENARIFAYYPNAFLKNSPKNPSIKLFNALVFTLSLMILFLGFYHIGYSLLGLLLALLINVTPFFVYEIYCRENIFGLMGSAFFLILGLNVSALFTVQKNFLKVLLKVVFSAAAIGFLSEIRNEISCVIVSLIFIYLLTDKLKIFSKLFLILVIISSFVCVKSGILHYFDRNFEKTKDLVEKHKGHVYAGPRMDGHRFWHPVFCGLGDFDNKYGYAWDDRTAYKYAIPILKSKYNIVVNYEGKYLLSEYHDSAKLYDKRFDEIQEYQDIVRDKVLLNIRADPIWYFTIILKRILRTFTKTLPFPLLGGLFFPLMYYLFRKGNWNHIKMILASLPICATPILIYSGQSTPYNSVFAYLLLAISMLEFYYHQVSGNEGR